MNKLKDKFSIKKKSNEINVSGEVSKFGNKSPSQSLQGSNLSYTNTNLSMTSDMAYTQNKTPLPKDANWRVGLYCKKDCYYILLEILKCLENMGYEWKLVSSSYKVKCRKKNEDHNQGNKGLNILIQIFGVSKIFIINLDPR